MAKLIISRDDNVMQPFELTKDRITIGRHAHNDIVIEHRAVSGEHAAITLMLDDAFIEDLGSTNGTFINGMRIARRRLEDRDQILVAKFNIEFIAGPRLKPVAELPVGASIEVKTGPNAGKVLALTKPLSTLGRPGVQVVAITRQGNEYFFKHVDGELAPVVNGRVVTGLPIKLEHGDTIELSGTSMIFRLT